MSGLENNIEDLLTETIQLFDEQLQFLVSFDTYTTVEEIDAICNSYAWCLDTLETASVAHQYGRVATKTIIEILDQYGDLKKKEGAYFELRRKEILTQAYRDQIMDNLKGGLFYHILPQ